ncbi:hypothetical protein HK405_009249 [Cladochytrium tenue]|nr:hypothetical protein HK405_009249 [Cladochytrium tenue]
MAARLLLRRTRLPPPPAALPPRRQPPSTIAVPAAASVLRLRSLSYAASSVSRLSASAAATAPPPSARPLHAVVTPTASLSTLARFAALGPRAIAAASVSSTLSPAAQWRLTFSRRLGSAAGDDKRGFGALTREYGPIAVAVYAVLSTCTFIICLTSIYLLGIDKNTIFDLVHRAKALLGFHHDPAHPDSTESAAEDTASAAAAASSSTDQADAGTAAGTSTGVVAYLPDWLKSHAVLTLATNVLVAMAMTKLFIPVKLTIVAFVTPAVARRLRAMGFDFGKRGYREMAKDARGRVAKRMGKP